jgi:hypothetical protein
MSWKYDIMSKKLTCVETLVRRGWFMNSLRGIDLLLLPSSIGILDLIRIHKLIHDRSPISEPASVPTHNITSAVRSQSYSEDNLDQDPESSFHCESTSQQSILSFSEEDNRAPCPLQLISKSVRRKLHFDDDKFSQWFEQVFEDYLFFQS